MPGQMSSTPPPPEKRTWRLLLLPTVWLMRAFRQVDKQESPVLTHAVAHVLGTVLIYGAIAALPFWRHISAALSFLFGSKSPLRQPTSVPLWLLPALLLIPMIAQFLFWRARHNRYAKISKAGYERICLSLEISEKEVAKFREEEKQRTYRRAQTDEKILLLALEGTIDGEDVSRHLNIGRQVAQFHLKELEKADNDMLRYRFRPGRLDAKSGYEITHAGMNYLLERGLVPSPTPSSK